MHKGQQFQLPMFMSANEVLDSMPLGDDQSTWKGGPADTSGLLTDKLLESMQPLQGKPGTSLWDDIAANGVQKPLEVGISPKGNRWLYEGHHRLAVMRAENPDAYFPVTHLEHVFEPVTEQPDETDGIGSEWADA